MNAQLNLRKATLCLAAAAALHLAAASSARAQPSPADEIVSGAAYDPAERFGAKMVRIEVNLKDPRACKATFDTGNVIQYTPFGDVATTTVMEVQGQTVGLTEVTEPEAEGALAPTPADPAVDQPALKDPSGAGRRLFELRYRDKGRSRFRLVVPKPGTKAGKLRLLRVSVGEPARILDVLDLPFGD